MQLSTFVHEREPTWLRLEALVGQHTTRGARPAVAATRELALLYRASTADLAAARRAFPDEPVVTRLEAVVTRTRLLLYTTRTDRTAPLRYLASGYWRAVAERPQFLAIAVFLLFGSALASGLWAFRDPAAAAGLLPADYQGIQGRKLAGDLGVPVGTRASLAAGIFTNNIGVTLATFALGVTGGVGSSLLLLYNGVMLGVVSGVFAADGQAAHATELLIPHGLLELSCICVAGSSALKLGWAVVAPGRLTRMNSIGGEARAQLCVVAGTAPWLVVAGLVEGLVTGSGLGLAAAIAVALVLAVPFWTLVVIRGRPRRPGRQARPRSFARR